MKIDQGPRLIVGHVTDDSAKIWGRGDAEHPVMFVSASDAQGQTVEETVSLSAEDGYTGVAGLEGLAASTDYELEVTYGASPQTPEKERVGRRLGHLETFPGAGQDEPFTMILASCNFHGWGPFRSNHKSEKRFAEVSRGADLVIHAGDQVYADKAPISFSLDDFRGDYERTWGKEGLSEILSHQANYMIPDDHEVVNGFAEDGELTRFQRFLLWARGHHMPQGQQYQEMTDNAVKAFQEFQRSHNPQTYGPDANYYTFSHGQHQFFALDTRMERNIGQGRLFSDRQRDALFKWLTDHRDRPSSSSPAALS